MFKKLKPFILSLVILILDQVTKILIIKNVPLGEIAFSFGDDFLWIVHVRNLGMAFSMGHSWPNWLRVLFLILVPLLIVAAMIFLILKDSKKSKEDFFLSATQKWFAAGILGGALGTLTDRIFRFDEGVVDFVSVKFYGIFGMERWPTFNVSDSCIVVFVILMVISMFVQELKARSKVE